MTIEDMNQKLLMMALREVDRLEAENVQLNNLLEVERKMVKELYEESDA